MSEEDKKPIEKPIIRPETKPDIEKGNKEIPLTEQEIPAKAKPIIDTLPPIEKSDNNSEKGE